MQRTILFAGVAVLVLALAQPARATSGRMVITSDTTLTEDHYGDVVIDADGVTLDCAGFRVVAPGFDPPNEGIVVAYHSGVTIRNCIVQGFARGILLDSSTATTVVANRLVGNGEYGIFLYDADGNDIVRNEATGNPGSAYGGSDFDWNTFAANVATGNGGHGFDMTRSSNNTFQRNVVTENEGHGFKVLDGTDYNVFDRNRASHNGMIGFLLYGGYDYNQNYQLEEPDHNTFSNNLVIANGNEGVVLGWDSTENLVTGNIVQRNASNGILLDRAIDNTVMRNVACRNGSWDASQDGGSGNVWMANVFCTTSGI